MDRGIIQRGFAGCEAAPGLDGVLGLLDIFQERQFAVIAAPAPGFEQFGEMLEPLLGQRAPAVKDFLRARYVRSLCHEKVRKEENGRETQRITPVPIDILWKTFSLSSDSANDGASIDRKRCRCGLFLSIHSQAARGHGRD